MKISLIIPIYNEEKNIPLLYEELANFFKNNQNYEIIAINDGSKDGSVKELKKIAEKDNNFKIINFRVNSGQTAAISAGIENATGDVIIPIDSDLENDPKDIKLLIEKMKEGYDVVSGWRKDRWKGSFLSRKLPSFLANALISKITKVKLHDYGCTLKAYRKDVIQGFTLYGEMHRFIPAFAYKQGARVTEVPVNYRTRRFGKSNYGISRTFRVILDLVLIKFLHRYMNRPIHFFGGLGFLSIALGFISGFLAIGLRLCIDLHFVQTPLPTLTIFLWIAGIMLIGMGILAEMIMRVYYESSGKKPYDIREKINF